MEFVYSNFPPMRTRNKSFFETFCALLPQANSVSIAVGYITADSIVELQKLVELNNIQSLDLIIGMHYFEKFTKLEYNAAIDLNAFLEARGGGTVRLVTPFKFHGKLYCYGNQSGAFAGIIGSNNLSSLIENRNRVYETALLIDDVVLIGQMQEFISNLSATSTKKITEVEIHDFKKGNPLLEGHENVIKLDESYVVDVKSKQIGVNFEIPIKVSPEAGKSNINSFFGEGRRGPNGVVKPRHWYEVELIVPKNITSQEGYPQEKTSEASFYVVTDDGWKFKCKISGTNSKNFRSEDDLKILGKWLKGRLENEGVLRVGELVTEQTLERYGRRAFTFSKTTEENIWFLDFGVNG